MTNTSEIANRISSLLTHLSRLTSHVSLRTSVAFSHHLTLPELFHNKKGVKQPPRLS